MGGDGDGGAFQNFDLRGLVFEGLFASINGFLRVLLEWCFCIILFLWTGGGDKNYIERRSGNFRK